MNINNQPRTKAQEFDTKSASERLEELDKLSPRDIEIQIERTRPEETIDTPDKNSTNKNKLKNNPKPRRQTIDKKQLDESFDKIMSRVQNELSINDRFFSKIIHKKSIEKTSNILAKTIVRPNAVLFGSVFAFISTLIIYITAKTIGYTLSGSETILMFVIGWASGLLYDLLKMILTKEDEV